MCELLINFLKNTKNQLNADNCNFHIVIGNQACDLDSAVCALCLACHLHYTAKLHDTTYIPVLNIKRSEYRIKTEVKYVLKNAGIIETLLTFRDDIDLESLQKQHRLQISLVDFNHFNDNLDTCVVKVIDHHVNTRTDQVDALIETVGSCSTLVGEVIFEGGGGELGADEAFMLLLYAAILTDTSCLRNSSKSTSKDVSMVAKIENCFPRISRKEVFRKVSEAKDDVEHFSIGDLVLKDMKAIQMDTTKFAISSIKLTPCEFFMRDSPQNVLEALRSFARDDAYQLMLLMFVSQDTSSFKRHIALFCECPELLQKTIDVLKSNKEPPLQLEKIEKEDDTEIKNFKNIFECEITNARKLQYGNGGSAERFAGWYGEMLKQAGLVVFRQWNVDASRKVVLPLLQQHLPFLLVPSCPPLQ